jgi:hypothetical protein
MGEPESLHDATKYLRRVRSGQAMLIPRLDRGPIRTVLSTFGAVNRRVRELESSRGGGDRKRELFRSDPFGPSPNRERRGVGGQRRKWRIQRGFGRVGATATMGGQPLTKAASPRGEAAKTPYSKPFQTRSLWPALANWLSLPG